MIKNGIGVGIIGGSGYGAGELLRLLASHPRVTVATVSSHSYAGAPLAQIHPHLAGFYDLQLEPELNVNELRRFERTVIFSALPHGVSAKTIEALCRRNDTASFKVIDLSGDFRIHDPEVHARFYPESECGKDLRPRFCYGLPEVFGERIKESRLIANPGCYATACLLALAPLVGEVHAEVFFDAKSGSSGAGQSPSPGLHHPALHADLSAYKPFAHRHEPEIQQVLGSALPCSFVPHLLPISRGIYVSAHLKLDHPIATPDLLERYRRFYRGAAFVRVREDAPHLTAVVCSNFCDVSVTARGDRVLAVAALDNLVKGMAGQAIQNMNLMCGAPEDEGLRFPAPGLI